MISLLVLGSGGAIPTPDRGPAAYWLEIDGRALLLDPGPGALVRLVAHPGGPGGVDDIRTVLLTHLHLDHCADLAPLLFALHSPIPVQTAPLQIIGPCGIAAYLDRLRGLYGRWLEPEKRAVVVSEMGPGDILIPAALATGESPDTRVEWQLGRDDPSRGAQIAAYAAQHSENRFSAANLCFRVRDRCGATLAFSGDSESGEGLLAASRAVDLFVVECSTPDELATPGHMTPGAVGELCRQARPRRVVLTHLYPPAAALDLPALVARRFAGPVEVARDGDVYIVP